MDIKKKSIFFTIDALIAASLILITLVIASSFYVNKNQPINVHYHSSDMIKALSELKINEVINNSYVKELNESGDITNYNNSIIMQIGELWAEGKKEKAKNLTREFTTGLLDDVYSYGVTFNDDIVYQNNKSGIKELISSHKILSGIAQNRSREGYNARATAKKIRKNMTEVFSFTVCGSAHDAGNTVNITKKFYLDIENENNITNATFYVSFHYGTSNLNSNKYDINNGECSGNFGDIDIIDTLDKNNTHMVFGIKDITDCLQDGWNSVKITLHVQSSGHTHLHPGTRVQVSYQKEGIKNVSKIIKKKIYFENIESKATGNKKSGAWAIMPLFKPDFYNMLNATLYINGRSIYNENNKDNIQIYLNNLTLELTDPPCNPNQDCDFTKTYNILNNLSSGTNVVSVYFNTYDEEFWGKGDTILYSDQENDPTNSSYIEFSYEITEAKLQYGKIDILLSEKFNTQKSNDVTYNKWLNQTSIYESSVELVQLDSDEVTLYVNGDNVFSTPRALATPNSLFVDPEKLIEGNNQIRVIDSCNDCYILNYTLFYYAMLIPSLVGYGDTFDTEQEAIQDAVNRLEQVLGPYVEAVEIENNTVVIGNVPSMWLSIAKVVVWR